MKKLNLEKPFLNFDELEKNYQINKNFINPKFTNIIVIGVGGSSQGSKAISSFLNEERIVYFDHLSSPLIMNTLENFDLKSTAFLFISKSGKTSEVLTIFDFLCEYCDSKLSIRDNFFVITDKNESSLEDLAKHKNISILHSDSEIGGRFSIFGLNSLIPSFYFETNRVHKFFEGARSTLTHIDKLVVKAERMHELVSSGKVINLNLVYGNHLTEIVNWKKQLFAESLGKNGNGFMPITVEMPKEQHSLLQLMMDGPQNIFYDLFSSNPSKPNLINITLQNHKTATHEALLSKKFEVEETIIDEEDLLQLGQFFVEQMIIVMQMANINDIDPFSQNEVEIQKNFLN